MKKILIVFIATLCAAIAFGQDSVRVTKTITLYSEPDLKSITYTYIYPGGRLVLGNHSGEFRAATFKKKQGFLHDSSIQYLVPDSVVEEKPALISDFIIRPAKERERNKMVKNINPGLLSDNDTRIEMASAGKLMLAGTCLAIPGAGLLALKTSASGDPESWISQHSTDVNAVLLLTGFTSFVLQIAGYLKLIKAGERISFEPASTGIGLSVRF